MSNKLLQSHFIFPTSNVEKTAKYYREILGFKIVRYMDSKEPDICLYREIILTDSKDQKDIPNRKLYGYRNGVYFITEKQSELKKEFQEKRCQNR